MRRLLILIILCLHLTICYSQTTEPTVIKLKEFTIEFVGFASYDKTQLQPSPATEIYADLGEEIESTIIKISSEILDKIELEQRVETSITIMDEGPHCDLVDWKHFTSDWKKLKEEKKLTFRVAEYNNGETSKFPVVDMKELVNEANKRCGQRWADLAKAAKSPSDYPCEVSVSRYFIKVIGIDKRTGKKFEQVITIRMPMGC